MAADVDDLLSVLLMARWAGYTDTKTGQVPLDVAPLFESVEALERSGDIISRLLSNPAYRAHLAARGDQQVVMIGYSDSNKESGIVSSRWLLRRAQEAMTAACAAAGVRLLVFHGRGGSISRGGSRTEAIVRSLPAGVVGGRLRVTEQGESINDRYGLRPIALRTFEQGVNTLTLLAAGYYGVEHLESRWLEAMDLLARASRERYRAVVHDDPAFLDFFLAVTPVDVIERMQIGSRPVSRQGGAGVDALRPVPWMFAWSQSRHMLPGWFGAGAGLAAVRDRFGAEILSEMYGRWPFFEGLMDDVELRMARADLGIAAQYEDLAPPILQRIATTIRDEYQLAAEQVQALKGCARLLDSEPTLQRSIRLRNPYVDPIHLTQVDLLRRWRETNRDDRELFEALLASVNGIAQGLQGTV
jgi:phosphoenolpyruvate carboxylase